MLIIKFIGSLSYSVTVVHIFFFRIKNTQIKVIDKGGTARSLISASAARWPRPPKASVAALVAAVVAGPILCLCRSIYVGCYSRHG